jgi:hypothetical protein
MGSTDFAADTISFATREQIGEAITVASSHPARMNPDSAMTIQDLGIWMNMGRRG